MPTTNSGNQQRTHSHINIAKTAHRLITTRLTTKNLTCVSTSLGGVTWSHNVKSHRPQSSRLICWLNSPFWVESSEIGKRKIFKSHTNRFHLSSSFRVAHLQCAFSISSHSICRLKCMRCVGQLIYLQHVIGTFYLTKWLSNLYAYTIHIDHL